MNCDSWWDQGIFPYPYNWISFGIIFGPILIYLIADWVKRRK